MRAYLVTTGLIFLAVVAAHIARMLVESPALARDPGYLGLTVLSAALAGWAGYLLRASGPRPR